MLNTVTYIESHNRETQSSQNTGKKKKAPSQFCFEQKSRSWMYWLQVHKKLIKQHEYDEQHYTI